MAKAIWNGKVIAESDTTEIVEGNVYFPEGSLKREYFRSSSTTSTCPWKGQANLPRWMQVGIIAFRREVLAWFLAQEPTPLEKIESVDMNRVLEHGRKIRLIKNPNATLGVDTPEELKTIEGWLLADPVTRRYLKLD